MKLVACNHLSYLLARETNASPNFFDPMRDKLCYSSMWCLTYFSELLKIMAEDQIKYYIEK